MCPQIAGEIMYDLTSILVTISAASASFVAILGGFIASKLLSINGARDAVKEDLENLHNELDFLQSENARLQAELDEDDALSFVLDHLDDLLNQSSLNECYPLNERVDLSIDTLTPYWAKALEITEEMRLALLRKEKLNSDSIPDSIAKKYVKDDFAYCILKETIEKLNPNPSLFAHIPTMSGGLWQRDVEKSINANNIKIQSCKYEITQLNKRKKELHSPKGMKLGLSIFASFTILCIILPLCFCPFTTDDYQGYLACKIIFISIFAIGLLATFLYLVYLLRWSKTPKSIRKDKRK